MRPTWIYEALPNTLSTEKIIWKRLWVVNKIACWWVYAHGIMVHMLRQADPGSWVWDHAKTWKNVEWWDFWQIGAEDEVEDLLYTTPLQLLQASCLICSQSDTENQLIVVLPSDRNLIIIKVWMTSQILACHVTSFAGRKSCSESKFGPLKSWWLPYDDNLNLGICWRYLETCFSEIQKLYQWILKLNDMCCVCRQQIWAWSSSKNERAPLLI